MSLLHDQEALQMVLENLSNFSNLNNGGRMQRIPSQLGSVGTFYNVTERNSIQRENQLARFDIRNPAPGLGAVPNVTEHVTVPSSEHVAEIVGRQGCKIKALRNKTNTYIKTPGRGEDPLFIITGQRDDVALAVHEIKQASAHFTNIRAQRNKGLSPPVQDGHVTDRVQVPYRVVGLVVGPKGQTIKQIQTKTSTYIVTPSREREPIFEISGMPDNVAKAREEIISYITVRTGMFLEENAVGQLTLNGAGSAAAAAGVAGKTPTGIWNPNKQDIDEFDSVSDVLVNTMSGIYGENAQAKASQFNVRPFTGRSLSLTNNNNSEQAFCSKASGIDAKSSSVFAINNDENHDPVRAAFQDPIGNLLKSPMRDLNINTYNPFTYDSSVLLQQGVSRGNTQLISPIERDDALRHFRFGLDSGSGPFGMSELAKVSPQSSNDGSQHSDPSSDSSLPGAGGSNSPVIPGGSSIAESVASSFGLFMPFGNPSSSMAESRDTIGVNTWVLSPPRPSAQLQQSVGGGVASGDGKQCGSCFQEPINSLAMPCGHRVFCASCAKDLIGLPCPTCAVEINYYLRV